MVKTKTNVGKIAMRTGFALCAVFLAMQALPIPMHSQNERLRSPEAGMAQTIDPKVGRVLDRACGDCHSEGTRWPWYSRVAPVSWMMARHVDQGKEKLNFTGWSNGRHTANELEEICDAVSDGSMPLPSYRLIHRNARLSNEDVSLICKWTETATDAGSSLRVGNGSRH